MSFDWAVLAHGIVGREDLPIPRQAFFVGATVVLVASFVALATLWPKPRFEDALERRLFTVPRVLEVLAGALGVAVFGFLVYAGLKGTQSVPANIVPTSVHVIFWVGIPILSLFLGDVFRPFNPWRAIGRAGGWLAGRAGAGRLPEPLPYPDTLGWWPAVGGIAAYGWLENVSTQRDDPSTLAILALVYAAIQIVGMSLYGVEAWSRRGDGFGVYFRLFASLSAFDWRERAVRLRRPLTGVTTLRPEPGLVGLVVVAIGVTTFDGFKEGPIWSDVARNLNDAWTGIGLSAGKATDVTYTIGLLLILLLVFLLYRLGVAGMRTVDRERSPTELGRAFAHSLVPIALAYVVAHYFSLLAYQGQAMAYLVSDPLGRGSDVFGTVNQTIDYGIVSANGIWYVQVGSLILGHVSALVLAHDRALVFYRDPSKATGSQYWMLAVMVCFTTLGLYLLSAANQ
ncbi:MAG TPA: fenitrothion hydrolase [Solirubrobacteraceae bacterium]